MWPKGSLFSRSIEIDRSRKREYTFFSSSSSLVDANDNDDQYSNSIEYLKHFFFEK